MELFLVFQVVFKWDKKNNIEVAWSETKQLFYRSLHSHFRFDSRNPLPPGVDLYSATSHQRVHKFKNMAQKVMLKPAKRGKQDPPEIHGWGA